MSSQQIGLRQTSASGVDPIATVRAQKKGALAPGLDPSRREVPSTSAALIGPGVSFPVAGNLCPHEPGFRQRGIADLLTPIAVISGVDLPAGHQAFQVGQRDSFHSAAVVVPLDGRIHRIA